MSLVCKRQFSHPIPDSFSVAGSTFRLTVKYKLRLKKLFIVQPTSSLRSAMAVVCPFFSHGAGCRMHAIAPKLKFCQHYIVCSTRGLNLQDFGVRWSSHAGKICCGSKLNQCASLFLILGECFTDASLAGEQLTVARGLNTKFIWVPNHLTVYVLKSPCTTGEGYAPAKPFDLHRRLKFRK